MWSVLILFIDIITDSQKIDRFVNENGSGATLAILRLITVLMEQFYISTATGCIEICITS